MSAKYIPLTIENEYIKGANVVIGAAGSHDDVYLKITFGSMWDGLFKRIVWFNANKETPTVTILDSSMLEDGTDNVYTVPVPANPKALPGKMIMTVKGTVSDDDEELVATLTAAAEFIVLDSAWDDNAQQQDAVPPSVAEQLQAEIDAIMNASIYLATYNVSTYDEISAAYSAQAEVIFYYNNLLYRLVGAGTNTFIFTAVKNDSVAYCTLDNSNTWTFADAAFATSADLAAKQDTLVSGTNIKTVGGNDVLGSGNIPIAYPQKAIIDVIWNSEIQLDVLAANQSVTLPTLPDGISGEIRLTAKQGSGNSYTVTLVAPTGVTITDGNNSGSSLVITPTAEKYIEISAAVIEDIISVITYEVSI